jgi:hypothetical protein
MVGEAYDLDLGEGAAVRTGFDVARAVTETGAA